MKEHELPEDEPEGEIVDALPVLADVHAVESAGGDRGRAVARVQTAAVAATGFLAGAATAAVLGRQVQRQVTRIGRGRQAPAAPEVLSTRTFLVTVHQLGRREN